MVKAIIRTLAAGLLILSLGCATTPQSGGPTGYPFASGLIADLDRALENEKDPEKIPPILFERGHAYFDIAEQLREHRRADEGTDADGVQYATIILYALRDFELVVNTYPSSTEAPEAMYHLGVIYDYPNISSFGPALRFYKRTVKEYPDTESALMAARAIKIIEDNVKQVITGEHGKGI